MLYYLKKGMEKVQGLIKWVKSGDFLLGDAPCSRRPVEVDSDQIKTLSEHNQPYVMWEIDDILKISRSSTEHPLHQPGYINHFDVWVPHKLSEKNLHDHISTSYSLLKHNKNILFFFKNLWWVMKNVYCTLLRNGRNHSASEMNHHQPHQRLFFIQRCCVYGGISRESSIMSSFWKTR